MVARARKQRLEEFDEALHQDPTRMDRARLDSLLEEYQVGFLRLAEAQRKFHRCVFRTALDEGVGPHAEAAVEVGRVTSLKVLRELERGQLDPAIDDLQTALRLARDIRSRGNLRVQRVSLAIERRLLQEVLEPILRCPDLRVEHSDRLIQILKAQTSEGLDPFVEGFRTEYLRFGQLLHEYLGTDSTDTSGSTFLGMGRSSKLSEGTQRLLESLVGKSEPRTFLESALRSYDDFHRTLHLQEGKPLPERIESAEQLPPLRFQTRHHPSLKLAPDIVGFFKDLALTETMRNAHKYLQAIRRWELSGRPLNAKVDPEAIIREANLPRVPIDSFEPSGGPLQLRFEGGDPVVQSVGLRSRNQQDPSAGLLRFRLRIVVDGR